MSAEHAQPRAGYAMSDTGWTTEQILTRIAEHIVEKNPAVQPHFQPYIKQKGIGFSAPQSFIHVDLKELYPQAQEGNTAFVVCRIRVPESQPMGVLLNGDVKAWFNQVCMFSACGSEAVAENGYQVKRIDAVKQVTTVDSCWYTEVQTEKDGDNELIIEVTCTDSGFCFDLNISHPKNITVWATDYLTWTREESPLPELAGEEGMAVSPLYENRAAAEKCFFNQRAYAFPEVIGEGTRFDLHTLYDSGSIAFAYTEAVCDGMVTLTAHGPLQLIVNGTCKDVIPAGELSVECKRGDKLLLKCKKQGEAWGFSVREKSCLGLPFVQMSDRRDLTFLFCGPFYQSGMNIRLSPEFKTAFSSPCVNEAGDKVYWRFYPEETYLRAYLDSCYYGQWYYAAMLCLYGIYMTGQTLDSHAYDAFFYEGVRQMAAFADYVRLDLERYGSAAFMTYSTNMHYLDFIGTMGVNFIEAYFKSGDPVFTPVIERLRSGIDNVVSRFPDGVFCRRQTGTMWADDLFMSCPFLVRLYRYTEDEKYLADAARQILGFKKRLYMPEEKLFSHIYFLQEETPNRIPWGRGNGWIAVAMSEVLLQMPANHAGREEILSLYREFMEGVCACQDESGLWHQLLNRPETYLETSCTAMFMLALVRGVRLGWLDEGCLAAGLKAWEGLKRLCIDRDGVIYRICMGSGCSMEEKYYAELATLADDDHGTGVVLMAVNELIRYENERGVS